MDRISALGRPEPVSKGGCGQVTPASLSEAEPATTVRRHSGRPLFATYILFCTNALLTFIANPKHNMPSIASVSS